MDFKFTGRLGKIWDTQAKDRALKEMGYTSLEEAIEKEREKIRLTGITPIIADPGVNQPKPIVSSGGFISVERVDAIASNAETIRNLSLPDNDKFKYAPPYSQPRLPYKDDAE